MCVQTRSCGNPIKTFVNNFGFEETQVCILEIDHIGKCSYRPDYKIFGKDETKIKNKLNNAALSTAGETAKNSPILNRGQRWSSKPLSMTEEYHLKKEGKYRIGIRKDEAAPFKNCSEIEMKLYDVVKKVHSGTQDETTRCNICGEHLEYNQFLLNAKNPNSIQICHNEPLNENEIMHNVDNCAWGHRGCNIMQGDNSILTMMERMTKIMNYQNSKNNKV